MKQNDYRIYIYIHERKNEKGEARMFSLDGSDSIIDAIGWLQKMGTQLVMEKVKSVGVDLEGDREPYNNEAAREKIQEI